MYDNQPNLPKRAPNPHGPSPRDLIDAIHDKLFPEGSLSSLSHDDVVRFANGLASPEEQKMVEKARLDDPVANADVTDALDDSERRRKGNLAKLRARQEGVRVGSPSVDPTSGASSPAATVPVADLPPSKRSEGFRLVPPRGGVAVLMYSFAGALILFFALVLAQRNRPKGMEASPVANRLYPAAPTDATEARMVLRELRAFKALKEAQAALEEARRLSKPDARLTQSLVLKVKNAEAKERAASQRYLALGQSQKALRTEADALREELRKLKATTRPHIGTDVIATTGGTKGGSPTFGAYSTETQRILRWIDSNPQNAGPGDGSHPGLISPPPGARGSMEETGRFVFAVEDDKDLEWGVWRLVPGRKRPQMAIPFERTFDAAQGCVSLRPLAPLKPGEYAAGSRSIRLNSDRSEEGRSWHAYRVQVLTPKQREDVEIANRLASQSGAIAVANLFILGRLDEAAEALSGPMPAQEAAALRKGLEIHKKAEEAGFPLSVPLSSPRPRPVPKAEIELSVGVTAVQGPPTIQDAGKLRKQGDFLFNLKLYDKAAEKYRQAFDICERLGDAFWSSVTAYDVVSTLSIGGKHEEALAFAPLALRHARYADETRWETAPKSDLVVAHSGTAYHAAVSARILGRFEQALDLIRESQKSSQRLGADNLLALATHEEVLIQVARNDFLAVIKTSRRHLQILKKLPEGQSNSALSWYDQYADSITNLAGSLYQIGEFDKAVKACTEGLEKKAHLHPEAVGSMLSIRAAANIELGGEGEVIQDIASALDHYAKYPNPEGQASLETARAILHIKHDRFEEAEARIAQAELLLGSKKDSHLRESIKALRELIADLLGTADLRRGSPRPEAERLTWLTNRTTLLLNQALFAEAAAWARQAAELDGPVSYRALALNNLAWVEANVGDPKKACDLFEQAAKLYQIALAKVKKPEQIGLIQQRMYGELYARHAWTLWIKLGQTKEAFALLDRGRAMGLRSLRKGGKHASVEAILQARKTTLVLQYSVLDARRGLLAATAYGRKPQFFQIDIGPMGLRTAMEIWGAGDEPAVGQPPADERKEAKKLGDLLLGKLYKSGLWKPETCSHLLIVGDAPFQAVPFAALIDDSGERVIARFAVSYAPALWTLAPSLPSQAPKGRLYAAAFGPRDPSSPLTDDDRWSLDQAADVGRIVSGSTVRVGPAAREDVVLREMATRRVVFITGHAGFLMDDPMGSYFVLAPLGKTLDGLLQARDIAGKQIAAELAVLPSCETGSGGPAGGEGLLGMAWAFQAAGCPSVVATGWKVPGPDSRPLVRAFFDRLDGKTPLDQGLQKAMNAHRARKGMEHPYFWAGFRFIGDTRPVRL